MRALVVVVVVGCAAAGCGGAPSGSPGSAGQEQALARLRRLAAALAADDTYRALEVGDARDGIVFWGQPGAYPRPLFRLPPGASGPLSRFAERAGADGYYTDPTGYWREVGATLDRALAAYRVDAGPYAIPPEEELERAPPWGSLDTRGVRLSEKDYPSLEQDRDTALLTARQVQRYRFRAEVGGSSVTVFMSERGITHVILVWHNDA